MTTIRAQWDQALPRALALHSEHVNASMAQVLRIIGFDRKYVSAQGCVLHDADGGDYLDFLGGFSVFNLGHNPPALVETLREVLGASWPNLVQLDASPLSGLLASRLVARDPGKRLKYAYFGNSGAEAVECALKFSRAATGRPRVFSWDGGFHGLTMGALSLCGDKQWRERFGPFLPGCETIPFGDVDRIESELKKKDVAALILEPIQGEGGVRELSQDTWTRIQALCRKYGTLLVLDEIQTAFGRTGKFFAFEHWGLEPDMVCLAKALTNGFVPASATLGTPAVFEKVFDRLDRCMVHSSTFGENNLAMAAGLTVLEEIDRQGLVERSARMGERLVGLLRESLGSEYVKEVRGRGLMVAIEFAEPKSLTLRMGYNLLQKANKGLFGQMITTALMQQHRVLTQVAGHNLSVLKLSPPLVVSDAELIRFSSALRDVLAECGRFPGGIWDFGLGLVKRALSPAVD
ncbi:MAG: aspartate aminotransferase family protein [Planctomycetota bacterium]